MTTACSGGRSRFAADVDRSTFPNRAGPGTNTQSRDSRILAATILNSTNDLVAN
jgi:hypothetical protein